MAHQKVKAPKAVKSTKAWAIVSPKGKIMVAGAKTKAMAWLFAVCPYHSDCEERCVRLEKLGYRAVRVLILPLSK